MRFLSCIILTFLLLPFVSISQNNDCGTAEVICSSGGIAFNPSGPGINDFGPGSSSGCLATGEHQSAWYYFQFQPNTPPGSIIEFIINPNAGAGQDYDFAVFGPDVACGALGSPLRCSYAAGGCGFCPQTGLGMGATDFSESPSGDGFVAPIVVQPGQGFYLLIDNFSNNSTGFTFSWGGSAAPFLDCSPPLCNVNLTATPNYNLCEGAGPVQLTANATGVTNAAFYEWTSTNGGEAYLSNPFIRQPFLNLPPGFSGILNYTLTVTDGACTDMVNVTVNVSPAPMPVITGPTEFCQGTPISLSAGFGYSSYQWSTGSTGSTAAVSSSGTVSVTVTNAAGCPGVATYTVTATPPPVPNIIGDTYVCNGVTADLSVLGAFATYQWSPGNSPNPSITATTAGVYSVTVTDFNGCFGSSQFIVTNRTNPIPIISGPSQICPGGAAALTASNGYFDYSWSNNDQAQTTVINGPGTYSVTVEDGFGCIGSASTTITSAPTPMPTVNGTLGFCPGQSTTINVVQGFSSYSWSNGQTSQSSIYTTPGPQSVTVTNGVGCEGTINFNLVEYTAPTPSISGDLDICPGQSTTLSVATGATSYAWSPGGGMGNSISASSAGTYTVTVTNAQGCTGTATANLIHHPVPMPDIMGDNAICAGEQSTLNAGAGFSTYLWSNMANTPSINATTAGTYTVTVTNAQGCSGTDNFALSVNALPTPNITGDADICAGQSSTLNAGAGYTAYAWSSGQTTAQITLNASDTVSVTVTDANGCMASDNFILEVNTNPTPSITGNLSFCSGSNTLLNAGSGYASYAWSNGDMTATSSISMPGSQSVTVTDANGCTGSASVNVQELTELMPTIAGTLSFCTGTSTTLTAAPGYASYMWSNSMSGPTITVTAPGTYTVSVTDAGGCSGDGSVTVSALPLPTPQINGVNSFCTGATASLNAGTGYTNYQWSTMDTTQTINIMQPGTYNVTVTDANGCRGSDDFAITQTPLPTPTISGNPNFCPGTSTELGVLNNYQAYNWSTNSSAANILVTNIGTYSVTVTDALGCQGSTSVLVANYNVNDPVISGPLSYCPTESTTLNASAGFTSYEWNDGTDTPAITADQPGNYTVTVIDANGCETSASVAVSEFVVTPPSIAGNDEFCNGSTTTLTAEAGYASYTWSDNTNGPSLTVSAGGIYTVTAVDMNGCESETPIQITRHPLPMPAIGGSLSYCIGGSTTLNSGANYAAYQWTGGASTSTLVANTPGVYGLTVTDANGCTGSTQVTVSEDTELSPVISGPLAYCENGSTILDAGSGYATYQWTGGGSSQTITVTAPGSYMLSVTDGMGCSGSTSVNVIENPLPQPQIAGALAFCDGASTTLNAGAGYASYLWSTSNFTPSITVQNGGTFAVTVTDDNGCVNQTSVAVVENPLPVVSIMGDPFFCAGASANLATNMPFTAYQWSNMQSSPTIQVSTEGNYRVTVTDANGCQSNATFFTDMIALPTGDSGPDQFLDCNDTSIAIGGDGSSQGANFSYDWDGPGINASNETLRFPIVSEPGTYTLIITDEMHGCESLPVSLVVTDLAYTPTVDVVVLDVIDCNTPSVTLSGTGSQGGAGIVYEWLNSSGVPIPGVTGNTYQTTQAGSYTLRVIDTNTGCTNQESAVVESDFNYPTAVAGPARHLNCTITATMLDASASTSGPGITYSWQTQPGNILSGNTSVNPNINAPGNYVLTVTNTLNGCTATDAVAVTQDIQAPQADAGQTQEIDCLHPEVTLTGSGNGNAPLTYNWTLAGNSAFAASGTTFTTNLSGNYTLLVTNTVNGCTNTDVVLVTLNDNQPTALNVVLDDPTCFGDDDGSLAITQVTGGTPPYLYSVNDGAFSSRLVYNSLIGGDYEIVVQDATGCEYTLTVALDEGNDLMVDLGPDQYIKLGQTTNIDATVNIPTDELVSLQWTAFDTLSCQSCPRLEVGPYATTAYNVVVVDDNGCVARDQVTIFVAKNREIFVPNVFSPNGDGLNDVLMIFAGNEVARIKSFLVFNRWGESIFEVYNFLPNDPIYGWNGTYRGQISNSAVFVYMAEVEFIDGEVLLFKGDAALMR